MTKEVQIKFDTGTVADAVKKIQAALDQLGLVAEQPGLSASKDGVRAVIFEPSWTAKGDSAIRDALVAKGLPGTFTVEATSSYGFQ